MTGSRASAPAMGLADWGLLLALSGLWSCSFLFYKVLADSLPPFTIVFGRVALAALALLPALRVAGIPLPRGAAAWRSLAFMGILNNVVPFSLIVYGETRIPSGLAAILNATTPLFTVLVGCAFAQERLGAGRALGIAVGILGVAVLVGPQVWSGFGWGDAAGQGACLLASLSYGLSAVYGRRFRALPSMTVATGQLVASSVTMLPLCLVVDRPWTLAAPSLGAWAALLALALPSTALAYLVFFRLLGRAGATNASLVTLLIPVGAVLLGAVALGERLGPGALAGMGLIGLGLLCIDGRLLRRFRGTAAIAR